MLQLHFPELCLMQTARIARIVEHHAAVRSFFLEPETPIPFQAGQFVALSLQTGGVERSYSIANEPNAPLLELCIALKPEGLMSPALFAMQEGDRVFLSEARGSFHLPADPVDICFICTGTGIAPFRSMLLQALKHGDTRTFHLISGNRTRAEALYHEEMLTLAQVYPNLHYHPVLSRESVPGFGHGYVHPLYQQLFADRRDARFLVCGWTNMLTDARRNLKEMGYNRRQYFFESYDG